MKDDSKALVVVEPAHPDAGPEAGRALVRELAARGIRSELRPAGRPEEARAAAREADAERTVVALGGHGTIGAVVDGVMRLPRRDRPRLAVLPPAHDAAEDAARGGGPAALAALAEAVARPAAGELDVGYLPDRDRYFALTVGIGSPAEVLGDETRAERHRRWGPIACLAEGLRDFVDAREVEVELHSELGRERFRAHTLLVCNASLQLPLLHLERQAAGEASRLDVIAIQGKAAPDVQEAIGELARGVPPPAVVRHHPVREASLRTSEPMAVLVDGEPAGVTPVTARIAPRAVRLCEVPQRG